MPKPAHTRCTFEGVVGTVAAPIEHFSFNINFPADALPANGTDIVADNTAEDAFGVWTTTLGPHFATDVVLTRVKVAHVNADGHVATRADGSYVQGEYNGSYAGPNAPQAMPLQTALCVSLTTGRAGPTGKGRFFLPWPGVGISAADKRLSSQNATDLATSSRNLLNGLATVMTFEPQVVSSKGYMSEVLGVRVGRVPDTMRSRREDIPEGYVSLPLA